MNIIWTILVLVSITLAIFVSPASVLASMTHAAEQALWLAFSLVAVYCVWLSVFEILSRLGALQTLAKLISPLIDVVYGKVDDAAKEYIALNISANLLGVGSAATPSAIKAIERMQDGSERASPQIIMLFVINATSIQLLPTTVMSMRAGLGSAAPADIVMPTLITTIVTTVLGILLTKLFTRKRKCRTT